MIRTQVYFNESDYQLIEALAVQSGIKKAVMVRKVVSEGIKQMVKKGKLSAGDALLDLAKMAEPGPKDLSENIDEYLYGGKSEYAGKKNSS